MGIMSKIVKYIAVTNIESVKLGTISKVSQQFQINFYSMFYFDISLTYKVD